MAKIIHLETRGFALGLLEMRKGQVTKTPDFESWSISRIIWSRLLREFILLGLATENKIEGKVSHYYELTEKGKRVADLLSQIEVELESNS